jgi:hypothetical protein
MAPNASQIINNMKRSFNAHLGTALEETAINFDQDTFDTVGLDSWYAIRYTGYSSEPTGMGDIIDSSGSVGRFHVLQCELSGWAREDSQRLTLGGVVDGIIAICETASIPLYDFSDPDDPDEIGDMRLVPSDGKFSPSWGSAGGLGKSSADLQSDMRIVGFTMEFRLTAEAEVN